MQKNTTFKNIPASRPVETLASRPVGASSSRKNDPFYSEKNMARIRRSIANADAGKLEKHDLIEV